jgi:hypothetical protein
MARTVNISAKKASASAKGRRPKVGLAASTRVSPRLSSKKNVEKGNEPEDPTFVSHLSPEFENEARNELRPIIVNTTLNENTNVAGDNEVPPLVPANERADLATATIDEVSQMLVDINGNMLSKEPPSTEEFEDILPQSFEKAAQTTGVPIECTAVEETIPLETMPTDTENISNARKLPVRCLIDVGTVETPDVLENWKICHGEDLTRTRIFFCHKSAIFYLIGFRLNFRPKRFTPILVRLIWLHPYKQKVGFGNG